MARTPPDNRSDEPDSEPDARPGAGAPDLAARLAELADSHPSAADYDRPGDVRTTADRRVHILDGDKTGGGHRHGTGRPGKTEFPAEWDDDHVIGAVLAIARSPDQGPEPQNNGGRRQVSGERDGVRIVAILEADGLVCTAWPCDGSPGVVKNELKEA